MKGYETAARLLWQKALSEHKNNIEAIWVISVSTLVNVGVTLMSAFTSYNMNIVKSESEIRF